MTKPHSDGMENESRDDRSLGWGTDRRAFLGLLGGTSTLALAGCSAPNGSTSLDDHEVTVESRTSVQRETAGDEERQDSADVSGVDQYLSKRASVSVGTSPDGGFTFDAPVVQIRTGGTVEWTVESGSHTVSAYHPATGKSTRIPERAEPFDSGLVQSGETFSHSFSVEGIYGYYCMPHEGNGMVGSVIVGDPDPEGQPALAEPDASIPAAAREVLVDLGERVRKQLTLPPMVEVDVKAVGDHDVFDPAIVRVRNGGTVKWTMKSGAHTVSAYHPGTGKPRRVPAGSPAFHSDLLTEGSTFELTLVGEGVYDYYCMPHESHGMIGSIVVGDPTPDGQIGLAAPQSVLPAPVKRRLDELNAKTIELLEAGVDATVPENEGHDQHAHDAVEVAVTVTDDGQFTFDPPVAEVPAGGTVTWRLERGVHTVSAYHPDNDKPQRVPDGAPAFDSGTLSEPGATFSHTFEVEGVYDYYCMPHEAMGMIGSLVVGNPDPDGQPGLAEPQSGLPEAARQGIRTLNESAKNLLGGVATEGKPDPTEVSLTGMEFSPRVVYVQPGESVHWTVKDGMHTVSAYHPDNDKPQRVPDGTGTFDSGFLQSGDTFEHAFDTEGVYDYYCMPHEGMGMVGSVVVGTPAAAEPGLSKPQSELPSATREAISALNEEVKKKQT